MSEGAPKEGEFHDGKLWFHRKGTIITLGVTLSGIDDIGDVEGIDFPEEGDDFDKGNIVVTLDGTNGKLEIITRPRGVVQEINESAKEEPDMVSQDPLEEGWLIKLEIQDTSDLKEYIN